MDLIFNELSLYHKAENKFTAQELIKKLLLTCKAANKFNFNRLRVSESFTQSKISEGYTIGNWLNDDLTKREYKTLLLGLRRYPFIDENDENIENLFIQNYYYLNMPEMSVLHRQESEGLAVAFLYNTISISFLTNRIWEKTIIELFEKTNDKEEIANVRHISCIEHLEAHRDWIETNRPIELVEAVSFKLIQKSLESLKYEEISENIIKDLQPIVNHEIPGEEKFWNAVERQIGYEQAIRYKRHILKYAIKTNILPQDKVIKLRNDHGKEILEKFANKLVNSPYIVEIINSIPYNPNKKDFIRQIYPDGTIEIVLTKTDKGLGLVAQTTGRNLQETKAIADIIQENYY